MFYDVIVIGAGLGGLMAAEAAQSAGARVLILAKGIGSLPLTSGCMDLLGYVPPKGELLSSPLAGLSKLPRSHPYHKLDRETMGAALARFAALAQKGGLPYNGGLEKNILLPTALGTSRPTCLVPQTMAKGNLASCGPVLLLGFAGLKDFSPLFACENLNFTQEGQAGPFRGEVLELADLRGKGMNALNLARAFDEKNFRQDFARRIQGILRPGERLGLPAVLGFSSPGEALADLTETLGTEIFEIPLPPPSVPGLRLYERLRDYLVGNGARIFIGLSCLHPLAEKERLLGFALGGAQNSPVYRASGFVLATGKFVGGGLEAGREHISESLLGIPVRFPRNRQEWSHPRLLEPAGHPCSAFGVEVDDWLRPLNERGEPFYTNLFAAGGIIAHADSMAEKSGGGVAICTGYAAGRLAAGKT